MILDCAKAYQTMFDVINKAEPELATKLDADGSLKSKFFQNFVIYLLIAPYDNAKVDLMNVLESLYARDLEKNDLLSRFVHKLLTYELMPMNEAEIEGQMSAFDPFIDTTENNKAHMRDFVRQLIQHNLRVIEKYYSKIKISTLSRLIGVPDDRAETEICDMVVNKRISARINRMDRQVTFKKKNRNVEGMLGDWNTDIKTMLDKIEQTCHLINRENIVHQ